MSFNTLSPDLQNILLVNHSYITKWLVFFVLIFLSAFYVWRIWPNHKQTIYFTQAFLRLFFYAISISFLFVIPITIIGMSPELDFYVWYSLFYKIYGVMISLIFIVALIDFYSLGIFWLLSKAGLDLSDSRINNLLNSWEYNKHFVKLNFLKLEKKRGKFGRK